LEHLVARTEAAGNGLFERALHDACVKHFGWPGHMKAREGPRLQGLSEFLDFNEIFCEEAERPHLYGSGGTPLRSAQREVNDLFDRHRFGYRLHDGQIVKIGSPALDEEIVGPALLAVERPGWEEVERSFKEAIQHQRAGADENDDALTAANAALEAAMKAAGFKGANLGPLTKDFRKSSLIPPELKTVPEALEALIGRSGALRSSYGDSHGKASGSDPVPQALVDLAIHWDAAFIVYLSDAGGR
jgi:hypothetical protein